jgi:excinuclease ABC subunit A
MPEEAIQVKGARVNNLKNVSFSVPINKMTVVTGVSGSGKSSLAFDTIYAEGQRRYVESLSAYARQFLERMDKPDVDEIHGIAPAIAIRQKNSTRNPRSTVGTQTEIYDYLRLLFARVGQTFCRVCGRLVTRDSPDSIADEVLTKLAEGTRFYVLFPASAGLSEPEKKPLRKKSASSRQWLTAHLMSLMQRGFTRLYFAGQTIDLQSPDDYQRDDFKDVYVLVDRLVARPDVRQRLVDSLEICFQEGHGTALIESAEPEPQRLWFSERFECKYDHTVYATPEPRLFSFNNPFGACPTCQGFGNTDRARSQSSHSQSRPVTERRRDRAMDQAAARVGAAGAETVLSLRKDLDDGAVQSALALRAERNYRRTRRLGGRARLLRLDGNEEVQAARARLFVEVSWLHVVSGLRRRQAASGSTRRKSQRQNTA